MRQRKERLTVTVDPDVVVAGNQAVVAGQAESLSGWVNAALAERAWRDRKSQALSAAIADYESEFGVISEHEIAAQQRADRASAVVVRGERTSIEEGAGPLDEGSA